MDSLRIWSPDTESITDYELELEVADEAKGTIDFIAFLEKNHIEYQKAPSKLVRFIEKSKKD